VSLTPRDGFLKLAKFSPLPVAEFHHPVIFLVYASAEAEVTGSGRHALVFVRDLQNLSDLSDKIYRRRSYA